MIAIPWTFNLQVKDGPRFSFNETLEVEAYDKIDVVVPGKSWLKVQVQPGELKDIDMLMVIRTEKPAKDAKRLYYKVNEDDTEVTLTNLHLVMGYGAFGLIKNSPNWLKFKNEDDRPAPVTILIGRKATPAETSQPEVQKKPGDKPPTETPPVEAEKPSQGTPPEASAPPADEEQPKQSEPAKESGPAKESPPQPESQSGE